MSIGVLRYEERESTTMRWVIIFVLLSLLAHLVIIGLILGITHFLPAPKFKPVPQPTGNVNVTLVPPPPAVAPPPKPIFVPTQPEANVKHKPQQVESANDTNLKSKSQVARDANSIMPDVTGKPHNPDLHDAPEVKAPPAPPISTAPPTPKQNDKIQKPTPPQPNPTTTHSEQKPETAVKPAPPKPNPKPAPAVDPNTGLPVLPQIIAPTLAPANSQSKSLAPAPSQRAQAEDAHGAIGMAGDNSPAAMATALGKYKQYVHDVVASVWYPDIDQHFGTIGVGQVTIHFTISSDGSIKIDQVEQDNNTEILSGISRNALTSQAPYKPFPPELLQELGTDSYSDEFSFSVY